ncbi:MAG: hypothetical protein EOS73_04620 [Mesorhizobium sp.]|uniref:hypothetical protein n=1 Tax=Mesorhizobium sp. M7A.F.Ca.ET.027.02.1.1 TaxID=2496655 RepID=UPI000FD2C263|nr:hypothetical protein [Mesorhizobium sp. M7A.F.Ca.ET.027.02.1.1]RVD19676.1 hypothetical protein EN749_00255 [Mesorhizobium sp. M7A.F.Ca.ET.027.02.1.1]RWD12400.1 MAG: hypothetical protein EOS73_04620 [Mesorhizobium sp.]
MRAQSFSYLEALIATPSPSGFEQLVAKLYRDNVREFADKVTTDVLGNVSAILNPEAGFRVMYAGHMDEIGFIVHYIDENGFLFFNTIGGTDVATEIGQRVWIHGAERVAGGIGRKAIQAFKPSDYIGDRPVVLGAAADRGHSWRYCRPIRAPGRSNGSMAAVALASLSQFSA